MQKQGKKGKQSKLILLMIFTNATLKPIPLMKPLHMVYKNASTGGQSSPTHSSLCFVHCRDGVSKEIGSPKKA